MSVVSALYSGISGINANGDGLSVAGDNIANMNTPGFKSSSALFETALSQRIGQADVGLGVSIASTQANFSQGSFATSTRDTDLGIDGAGFFILANSSGDQFFTRAGSFERNADGDLVISGGTNILQGKSISADGTVAPSLSSINLSLISSAPQESYKVTMSANLNSSVAIRTGADLTFTATSATAAQGTSDFNVSTTVYDSLGNARTVTTYFCHTGANKWDYHVLTDLSNINSSYISGTGTCVLQEGSLNFSSSGAFSSVASAITATTADTNGILSAGERIDSSVSTNVGSIRWGNGAGAVTVGTGTSLFQIDFGQESGSTAVMTQYSAENSTNSVLQDGRSSGSLKTIQFDASGTLIGNFSNGTSRDLFQVPLATFSNQEGLTRVGSNLYKTSSDSGSAQIGQANASGRGAMTSFRIEQSNVDLASEFVKIITFQRAFQASARTVSTASELLQDLVRLGQ